jgi:hypothetical protein
MPKKIEKAQPKAKLSLSRKAFRIPEAFLNNIFQRQELEITLQILQPSGIKVEISISVTPEGLFIKPYSLTHRILM